MKCTDVNLAAAGLDHHICTYYEQFCPIKTIKIHTNFLFKPSKELLAAIKLKQKLYRKYIRHKKKHGQNSTVNCSKCTNLWAEYKKHKNFVTKLSKANKRENVINDLKAKSVRNDLKGIWKTIKRASNISPSAGNTEASCNLDPNDVNEFFTGIGPKIQAQIPDNVDDNYMDYMDSPATNKFEVFDEVCEDQVLGYIKDIPLGKSTNDLIPSKVYRCIISKIISIIIQFNYLSFKNIFCKFK